MLHTFSVYLNDRPGVLNRVASLFRRRGFNIESLTVGHTERPGISRMTIRVDIEEQRAGNVEANLYKLMDVALVERIGDTVAIAYELALIKVLGRKDLAVFLPELMEEFHMRVVNRSRESLVLEVTGTREEIDRLVELLRPCGIVEMVRTGPVAMATGPKPILRRETQGEWPEGRDGYPEIRDAAD